MNLDDISENFWFTFFAYVAAFAPWTAIAAKDFISSQWKSVRHTRHAGYGNIFWSVIPAIYVVAYCTVKGLSRDYGETCAALIALAFALLHLLRTCWGLWQLEQFRAWAELAIESLHVVGVEYRLPPFHDGEEKERQEMSAPEIADLLLVNDKIIDNQIMNGDVQCYLKYGDISLKARMQNESGIFSRFLFVLKWIRVLGMVLCDVVGGLFGRRSARKFKQVPVKPVAIWVHWATLFASQGLKDWLKNFHVRIDPDKDEFADGVSAMDKFYARGRYFASEVFSSAILQLEGAENPFLWGVWDEQNNMSDGRIVKGELLRIAMNGGNALPFDAPHVGSLGMERSGYDSYREALEKFVGELPVESVYLDEIRTFDVEKLEWLTILVHLGVLCRRVRENSKMGNDLQFGCEGANGRHGRKGCAYSGKVASKDCHFESSGPASYSLEIGSDGDTGRNEQALVNLKAQLNMTGNVLGKNAEKRGSEGIMNRESSSLTTLPILSKHVWETSEGNRLVFQTGELIDVWIALVSGEQISFVVNKLNGSWTGLCLGPSRAGDFISERDDEAESRKLRRIHRELEKRRLQWRVADSTHRYGFRDHFVTFMGYRMESVRSAMARWVFLNEGVELDECFKSFSCGDARHSVKLSMAMRTLLHSGGSLLLSERRGMQCRLIWELQNSLGKVCYESMRDESTMGPEANSAVMLLFLLSFPSLHVQVMDSIGTADEPCKRRDCCCIELESLRSTKPRELPDDHGITQVKVVPICGPQRLSVVVDISAEGMCALSVCGVDPSFKWRWWRDAFLGRLEGFEKWQEEHEIESVTFLSSVTGKGITELKTIAGTTFRTWREWRPFRLGFCLFELESDKFLQQPCVTHSKTPFMRSQNSHIAWFGDFPVKEVQAVNYEIAEDVVLMSASVLVEDTIYRYDSGEGAVGEVGTTETVADGLVMMADGDSRLSLLALEMIAIQYGSIAALERSIDLLTGTRKGLEHFSRGPKLIQSYVALILSGSRTGLEMNEENRRKMSGKVIPLLKKLLAIWGDRREAYESLSEVLKVHLASDPRVHTTTVHSILRLMLFLLDPCDIPIRLLCDLDFAVDWGEFANAEEKVRFSLGIEAQCEEHTALCKETRRGQLHLLENAIALGYIDDRMRESRLEALQIKDTSVWHTCDIHKSKLDSYQGRVNKKDHARALTALGLLMESGPEGIDIDLRRSIALYESSIEVGNNLFAMTSLGRLLLNPRIDGVKSDAQRAANLFQRAADKGNVVALMNLASLLKNGADGFQANAKRAVQLYELAINEYHDVDAMCELGNLVWDGAEGVDRNAKRAKELYERAIEEGSVSAMYNLARMLLRGAEGVEVNATRAAELFALAIEKGGNVDAMFELANLLQDGAAGVDANPGRSLDLFQRAIEEGKHVESMYNMAVLLRRGAQGVEVDARRAAELFQRAIDEGVNVNAMYQLAGMLCEGELEMDVARAKSLILAARRSGKCADRSCGQIYRVWKLFREGSEAVRQDEMMANIIEEYCNDWGLDFKSAEG